MANTVVYLLHLKTKLGHAQHYIGLAKDLEYRISQHKRGAGSAFTKECVRLGIEFDVSRTWSGNRRLEWRLRTSGNHVRLCPICNPTGYHRRGNRYNENGDIKFKGGRKHVRTKG